MTAVQMDNLPGAGRKADSAAMGGKHAQRRPVTQPHECPVGEGRGVASERFHGPHYLFGDIRSRPGPPAPAPNARYVRRTGGITRGALLGAALG